MLHESKTKEWFRRRFIALAVVVALHCLFLLLILLEPIIVIVVDSGPSSDLFFVQSERQRPTVTTVPPVQTLTPLVGPLVISEPREPEQTSLAPTPSNAPTTTIDWTAHATEAAAAIVDKSIREETRKCDPSDSPNSFLPPCNPRTKQFEWNPEPPRVGFSGGLPYVRIGERCAIGLGFFGCGFGEPPPANGDLFEGMDDPERDRSSVPSPNP